jgi:hypothetical protein
MVQDTRENDTALLLPSREGISKWMHSATEALPEEIVSNAWRSDMYSWFGEAAHWFLIRSI